MQWSNINNNMNNKTEDEELNFMIGLKVYIHEIEGEWGGFVWLASVWNIVNHWISTQSAIVCACCVYMECNNPYHFKRTNLHKIGYELWISKLCICEHFNNNKAKLCSYIYFDIFALPSAPLQPFSLTLSRSLARRKSSISPITEMHAFPCDCATNRSF